MALVPGCFQFLSLSTLMSLARFVTECSHFYSFSSGSGAATPMLIHLSFNGISQYSNSWSLGRLCHGTEYLVGVQLLIPFLHPDQSSTSSQLLFSGGRLSVLQIPSPAPQVSSVVLCTVLWGLDCRRPFFFQSSIAKASCCCSVPTFTQSFKVTFLIPLNTAVGLPTPKGSGHLKCFKLWHCALKI